jgi:quercetin dioxygenase-like cupin family protein
MAAPESSEHGVAFDLGAIERELTQQEAYRHEGHTARTLVLAPDLRVVLVTLKGGSRIAEHHANESTSIHAVSGHVRVHLRDRTVDLPAGWILVLARGLEHHVEATIDSAFVLTLGWTTVAGAA